MPQQDFLAHLARRSGWLATPTRNGARLSRTGPQGQQWSVYVSTNSHWACFQWPIGWVRQEGGSLTDPLYRAAFYRYLLTLNNRMFMARFALDAEGRLLLAAEVPTSQAQNTSLVFWALESLTIYAGWYLDAVTDCIRQPDRSLPVAEPPVARRPAEGIPIIPHETLALYLKSVEPEGWGLREKPAGQTWHLGYKGQVRLFEVYLTLTASWAYFQAPLLVEPPPPALRAEGKIQAIFLHYLLRLNDMIYMARLGLDDEGQVLLSLELPAEALDFSLFHLAIRTLAQYLDGYVREVQIMSWLDRDRHLASLLTRHQEKESPQY